MSYPKSTVAARDALLAWTPHPLVAPAIVAAQASPSPISQVVQTFTALRDKVGMLAAPAEGEDPTPVLDDAGVLLLAGCAYLISAHGLHGLGTEAIDLLVALGPALAAIPPPAASPAPGGA